MRDSGPYPATSRQFSDFSAVRGGLRAPMPLVTVIGALEGGARLLGWDARMLGRHEPDLLQ